MNKVAVIGSGTMGNGIAQVFAQHGWGVTMVDVAQAALDRGLATIQASLERLAKKGVAEPEAGGGTAAGGSRPAPCWKPPR